jgi:hypothetical protein
MVQLNCIMNFRSELINFILTILSLNDVAFSKHIWIPLNAKHMDMKLVKERRNEVGSCINHYLKTNNEKMLF